MQYFSRWNFACFVAIQYPPQTLFRGYLIFPIEIHPFETSPQIANKIRSKNPIIDREEQSIIDLQLKFNGKLDVPLSKQGTWFKVVGFLVKMVEKSWVNSHLRFVGIAALPFEEAKGVCNEPSAFPKKEKRYHPFKKYCACFHKFYHHGHFRDRKLVL